MGQRVQYSECVYSTQHTLAKQKSYMLAYEGRVGLEPTELMCVEQKFLLDPHALPTELLSWMRNASYIVS